MLLQPEGKDPILKFETEDGGTESENSLYYILTGRTPVPVLDHSMGMEDGSTGSFEDKSRENKGKKEAEIFDESGMSEMF